LAHFLNLSLEGNGRGVGIWDAANFEASGTESQPFFFGKMLANPATAALLLSLEFAGVGAQQFASGLPHWFHWATGLHSSVI
jgi:hypothetical protein